jgi:hypothetical protein
VEWATRVLGLALSSGVSHWKGQVRLLCSVLGRGRSGVGRAGEMKPSVIEEADRDEIKSAMLENLTGVRKRERLAARQKARAAGGPILFEDLYGIHAFSDAGIAERCN